MESWLAEIKLRAKRKIGVISKNIESKQGKKAGNLTSSDVGQNDTKTKILSNSGLTKSVANRCEKIAEIPDELWWLI